MLNQLVTTSILTEGLTLKVFILAMLTAFGLGLISTLVYMYRNEYSKNFVVTLTLLVPEKSAAFFWRWQSA